MRVKIGKIVNVHGIKGELRVLSNSDFKDIRFNKNSVIYVDNRRYFIENAYNHKNFIIIKLSSFDNINDVLFLKNKIIEADSLSRESLEDGEYFNSDLEKCIMINQMGENRGIVVEVRDNVVYNLLLCKNDNNRYMVPFKEEFINDVDIDKKIIYFEEIKGLIDED